MKIANGVQIVWDMNDMYLVAEYDYHMIPDTEDYLMFIAGLYRRADMQKDLYPKELFGEQEEKING